MEQWRFDHTHWTTEITKTLSDIAEEALDDYEYKGHTLREWADKITSGEYQPVKHSRWKSLGDYCHICLNCGEENENENRYCPNCGARMDGEEQ